LLDCTALLAATTEIIPKSSLGCSVAADARQVEALLKAVASALEVRGCAVNLKRPHKCFVWDVWVHGSERWFRMGRGQVGMWVRTSGPKGSVAGAEPDAASWCVVRLRRERFDGGWCEADLLRPRSWLGGAGVGWEPPSGRCFWSICS
jgi:hypothetical protein